MRIGVDFFRRGAVAVARDLIGCSFSLHGVGGILVETEAYDHTDPASHCYLGRKTERNWPMFGPAGRAYVYRSYGIHWCLNFVTGEGHGSAVLIRALEPLCGVDEMRKRREVEKDRLLASGPGRVCEALDIDGDYNGVPVVKSPFELTRPKASLGIVVGKRIGITRAQELPWRFGLKDSKFLSRPF